MAGPHVAEEAAGHCRRTRVGSCSCWSPKASGSRTEACCSCFWVTSGALPPSMLDDSNLVAAADPARPGPSGKRVVAAAVEIPVSMVDGTTLPLACATSCNVDEHVCLALSLIALCPNENNRAHHTCQTLQAHNSIQRVWPRVYALRYSMLIMWQRYAWPE